MGLYVIAAQSLSQDLETGCLKLAFLIFWGFLFFKGDNNLLRLQPQRCIHSVEEGMISLYNVMGIIFR